MAGDEYWFSYMIDATKSIVIVVSIEEAMAATRQLKLSTGTTLHSTCLNPHMSIGTGINIGFTEWPILAILTYYGLWNWFKFQYRSLSNRPMAYPTILI